MPWVKLDDGFYDHPKIATVSNAAVGVWCKGLAYCNRQLTDGFIPARVLRAMCDGDEIAELVEAGLLDVEERGWRFHDYHDFQPSRDEALTLAEKRSAAGQAGAAKRWGTDSKSYGNGHGKPDGKGHSNGHGKPMANLCPVPVPVPQNKPQPSASAFDSDFEAVWRLYPRKVEKQKALKAYQARRRAGVAPERLLAAVTHYAEARTSTEQRFIKHGASFLGADGPWSEWVDGNPEAEAQKVAANQEQAWFRN